MSLLLYICSVKYTNQGDVCVRYVWILRHVQRPKIQRAPLSYDLHRVGVGRPQPPRSRLGQVDDLSGPVGHGCSDGHVQRHGVGRGEQALVWAWIASWAWSVSLLSDHAVHQGQARLDQVQHVCQDATKVFDAWGAHRCALLLLPSRSCGRLLARSRRGRWASRR